MNALDAGAAGVQVGTLFAFCDESGIAATLKHAALDEIAAGSARVFTDPRASATGYPFKLYSSRAPRSRTTRASASATLAICARRSVIRRGASATGAPRSRSTIT